MKNTAIADSLTGPSVCYYFIRMKSHHHVTKWNVLITNQQSKGVTALVRRQTKYYKGYSNWEAQPRWGDIRWDDTLWTNSVEATSDGTIPFESTPLRRCLMGRWSSFAMWHVIYNDYSPLCMCVECVMSMFLGVCACGCLWVCLELFLFEI